MELAEVLKQPEGFTPPAVTVTIEKVYAYKSGQSDNGPWSFQDVQVKGGGKLKLKNLPEFPANRIGQTVTLRAKQSQQHGLTGLKVSHEEYQNNAYDKLVITPSAKWEWGAGTTNGGGAQSGHVAAQNGVLSDAAYTDHLLSCAELANVVTAKLVIDDPVAVQACFATICIDTKQRNILLPKPKTLPSKGDEPSGPPDDEPPPNPFDDDDSDIPF
jgi:hypothetical protein